MNKKFDIFGMLKEEFSKGKHSVQYDKFDSMIFKDITKQAENLKKIPERYDDIPTIDPLPQDVFNLFFKYQTKFVEDEKIDPAYLINKTALQKAIDSEDFTKLKSITALDEVSSAVATVKFIQNIIPLLREQKSNMKQLQQDQQNKLKQQIQKQKLLQQLQNTKNKKQKQQLQQQIQKLNNQINQINQHMQKTLSQSKKQMRQSAINQAVRRTAKDVQQIKNDMDNLIFTYGNEISQLSKVDKEQRLKLAELLMFNSKIKELAKILGKVRFILNQVKKEKIPKRVQEIYSISMGNDISRLIPSETVKLYNKALRRDFYKRFIDKQLLQYALKDKQTKGKGDFVVCIDVSGSMNGIRELWAKAVALAILHHAIKQKRGFAMILFSEDVKEIFKFDRKHPPTLEDITTIAESYAGGGTNFERPLTKAVEILQHMKKGDILFITDGECEVSGMFLDRFNKFRKETKTKVVSVVILGETRVPEKFSDVAMRISDLVDMDRIVENTNKVLNAVL